jgi:hypothetical protein
MCSSVPLGAPVLTASAHTGRATPSRPRGCGRARRWASLAQRHNAETSRVWAPLSGQLPRRVFRADLRCRLARLAWVSEVADRLMEPKGTPLGIRDANATHDDPVDGRQVGVGGVALLPHEGLRLVEDGSSDPSRFWTERPASATTGAACPAALRRPSGRAGGGCTRGSRR